MITTVTTTTHLVPHTCGTCGVIYGFPNDLLNQRKTDGKSFYCPNGHSRYFTETDTTRLHAAQTKLTATEDQLQAARDDAEQARRTIVRERARFAAGVCPCCNRSFTAVRRHIETQHPDYDVTRLDSAKAPSYRCSCGYSTTTYRGLRTHQGHMQRYSGRHETKV